MRPAKSLHEADTAADDEEVDSSARTYETDWRARRPGKHDAYYLAPDSCEALPPDFWSGALDADLAGLADLLRSTAQRSTDEVRYDADQFLTPRIFALSDDERAVLAWVGQTLVPAATALDQLDGGAP
jgi:hypothetical protein